MAKNKEKDSNFVPNQMKKVDYIDGDIVFVTGACAVDYANFNTFHNFRKKWIQNIVSVVLIAGCGLFALLQKMTPTAIIFFCLAPIFPILVSLLQRLSVYLRLKNDAEFQNTSHTYVINDTFTAITKTGKREAKATIKYSDIEKIFERKKYYYIYVDNKNAFVINKGGIIQGNENEVNKLFAEKVGDRFIALKREE